MIQDKSYHHQIERSKNYIDLETFLDLVLYDNEHGFYTKINEKENLIGRDGHFVTGPEISQMFGELFCLCLLDVFKKLNFKTLNLVELGPGKGTLMFDIFFLKMLVFEMKILQNYLTVSLLLCTARIREHVFLKLFLGRWSGAIL